MKLEIFNGIANLIAHTQSETKSLNNITFDFQNQYIDDALAISIVGIIIVFSALIIIAFAIALIAKAIKQFQMKKVAQPETVGGEKIKQEDISGEINAAISMALHLYFAQVHDQESAILTIERVPRPYAPWSSKIYNIRKLV